MEAHADEIWEGVVADWMADDKRVLVKLDKGVEEVVVVVDEVVSLV